MSVPKHQHVAKSPACLWFGVSDFPASNTVFSRRRQLVSFRFNKANLRDFIAGTGLVFLLKFDSNRRFFSPCDLEIWWMTSKNYRVPLLHYVKLCVSSQTNRWIQTGVTVRKRSIRVKIGDFLSRVTSKFDGWPWKTIGHLFYATLSFARHFKARKRSIRVKISDLLSRVTLKIDGWPWQTIGHLS